MGISTNAATALAGTVIRRNPFQGGMGISTRQAETDTDWSMVESRNPFQGGMGISTHSDEVLGAWTEITVAIPFRVGWGFPLAGGASSGGILLQQSQSLSGWDGDFHCLARLGHPRDSLRRNPFQGGMGISTAWHEYRRLWTGLSRNPFQGGMGISTDQRPGVAGSGSMVVAIPFRVGWGFPPVVEVRGAAATCPVAIPFRVGWGFPL